MSTRSYIGVECEDGIRAVYCHFDGYLTGVGNILKTHYTDFMKVCELINGGDISSLGVDIGAKHDFNTHLKSVTTYYGRDRGEENAHCQFHLTDSEFKDSAEMIGAEYIYLFKNDKWYVTQSDVESFKEF